MKKLVTLFISVAASLSVAVTPVMAQAVETCTQVTQYGGAVKIVCGMHEPVDTGLADMNPLVLASIFFILAAIALNQYRKIQKSDISLN